MTLDLSGCDSANISLFENIELLNVNIFGQILIHNAPLDPELVRFALKNSVLKSIIDVHNGVENCFQNITIRVDSPYQFKFGDQDFDIMDVLDEVSGFARSLVTVEGQPVVMTGLNHTKLTTSLVVTVKQGYKSIIRPISLDGPQILEVRPRALSSPTAYLQIEAWLKH